MTSTLHPVGSFYPAQTGGPDNTVYWITKALKTRNNNPIIVATERGVADSVDRNTWMNTEYGKVIYTRNLIHYFPLKLILTALRQIRHSDVIHLTMIFYPASFIMAFINKFFVGKPVVWSVRGDLDPYMLKRSAWKKRPVLWLIRNVLKKGVVFHATCDEEARYLKDNFGEDIKIVLIPNYMEFPEQVKVEKENSFLYLGRIHPKKAIENLIEALALSKRFKDSNYILKIAGDHNNPYGTDLQKLADKLNLANRVHFVGHVEGLKKQELLAEAKFSFMPSHTENFGIVAMEAMAQATPVVASKGTPWEILEEHEAGFWTENDPVSLSKIIDQIIGMDQSEYEKYVNNAKRLATEEFNIYEKINEWIKTYEQISK